MPRAPRNAFRPRVLAQNALDDGQSLTATTGQFSEVWSIEGQKKKAYVLGQGTRSNRDGNAGFAYADIQTNNESANGAAPSGKARFMIYESDDREVPKWFGPEFDLDAYRDAAASDRTERPIIPQQSVGVAEGEVMTLEVQVDEQYDGDSVDAANCDVHLPYGQARR